MIAALPEPAPRRRPEWDWEAMRSQGRKGGSARLLPRGKVCFDSAQRKPWPCPDRRSPDSLTHNPAAAAKGADA